MGNEPIDEEIPVELEDLPAEVQESVIIYNYLQDNWDHMNGNYLGKNLAGFLDIMQIMDVDEADHKSVFKMVMHIDKIRAKIIRDSKPNTAQKPPF